MVKRSWKCGTKLKSLALCLHTYVWVQKRKPCFVTDSNAWQLVSSYRHCNINIVYWWTKNYDRGNSKNVIFLFIAVLAIIYKVKYIFFARRSKEILTVFVTNASSLDSLILDTILNALFGNHGVGILLYKTVDYLTTYADFLGRRVGTSALM